MKRFTSILVCLMLLGFQAIMAQDIQVSGTVTDASGAPLPGVSIVVKGTTTGTASNVDGNYELPVPAGSTLIFSSVGSGMMTKSPSNVLMVVERQLV